MIDLNHSQNLASRPRAGSLLEFTEPVLGRKPVLALLLRLLWAAALVLPIFGVHAGAVFTNLHEFGLFLNGEGPSAGLAQGGDGNFYGTTLYGGTNGGYGTVFKISTNGALTSLYSFSGATDGAYPQAGLVQGSDGYFYGTTAYGGGTNDAGTVFKINAGGALRTLYSFTYGNDGANPQAGLVQGSDGYFYGTTGNGGTNGVGTVFKASTNGTVTSLYSFTGTDDGANPNAGLVQGSDGSFYGTTGGGGAQGRGTVFKITTNGTMTSLYSFTGGNDGSGPFAGLVQGSDGSFYGTTGYGGAYTNQSGFGFGTVFKISTDGALTSLYSFGSVQDANGSSLDGANPQAALVQGSDGNFYGTTYGGGTNDLGTVFRISANEALRTLYSFTYGNDGANPKACLVQGTDGYFYGTTFNGGTNSAGTVFQISTNGELTSLCSFTQDNDGAIPNGLVQGSDGNFYGTTQSGGTNGYGTVFKISTGGALTSLYSFTNDGGGPNGLVQGTDGNLYGTTDSGGTNGGNGTVFKISTSGALTSLYSFNGNDGSGPNGLVQGSDGSFYGTTVYGGAYTNQLGVGYGTVFKISANGALTTLYSFSGGNGRYPNGALVQGSDGSFYGTTANGGASYGGNVFKISTNGALSSLYSFSGGDDGRFPYAGLAQGSDGNFYGTTASGGTNNLGTVFKITANGALTSLYSFTGGDGWLSDTRLAQGSDGYFYGTTRGDAPDGHGGGTVFQISTNGALTTLLSFPGSNDGEHYPSAGLVQGSDGSFYGTTSSGGQGNAGTVFRLTIVPEPPQLVIIPSGANVVLTWPTNATGFTLQSTTNIGSSAVWSTNSPAPVVVNGQNVVTNLISGAQQFFRLGQ